MNHPTPFGPGVLSPRDEISDLMAAIGLDQNQLEGRKNFMQMKGEDSERMRGMAPLYTANAAALIDRLYSHMLSHEETRRKLGSEANIARLKELQRRYFEQLFEGNYDYGHATGRVRIGLAHVRVDLKPQWYLGT